MKPLVSIICISYNHEKYIKQALEGFLMQEVAFSYEILIHDDASTDGTQKIIKEFIDKNPSVFIPLLETENQFSKTGAHFLMDMYKMAKGKYIAVCETDDYWTDPTKLQKQVDFLEKNQEYSMVFHPVKVLFQDGQHEDTIFPEPSDKKKFGLGDILKTNFIHTNSVLYRRQDYSRVNAEAIPTDWYMHLYHAQFGDIGFINETMAVYRRHDAGIWWETTHQDRDAIWKKHGAGHLVLYAELLKMYGDKAKHRRIIDTHIEGTVDVLSRIDSSDRTKLMIKFVEKYPETSSLLLLSLARTTYENYKLLEKKADEHNVVQHRLREVTEDMNKLEQERDDILNSKTYKVGNKIAQVSRIVRRIK